MKKQQRSFENPLRPTAVEVKHAIAAADGPTYKQLRVSTSMTNVNPFGAGDQLIRIFVADEQLAKLEMGRTVNTWRLTVKSGEVVERVDIQQACELIAVSST
jgi:hypothetical protein